jgi:transcriptional regulator with XRE-family HTH domain
MKKAINVEIGARVRKCREALGYSREALSEKADLATSFIGAIELGSGSFTAETLIKLCRALGVSADMILFGEDDHGDLSNVTAMLSCVDSKYIPELENLLGAYIRTITLSK